MIATLLRWSFEASSLCAPASRKQTLPWPFGCEVPYLMCVYSKGGELPL